MEYTRHRVCARAAGLALAVGLIGLASARPAVAQQTVVVEVDRPGPRLEIYGFAQLDMGYDFKQVDPNWFDVLRTTKLPSFENEFGKDGNFYAGVRQSRLGFKGYLPTDLGEIKTHFEFELFGVGAQAGETNFHLRYAWGEFRNFGAGQNWSPFTDPDVYFRSLEYWGPPGMAGFRNVQLRWMPMMDENELYIALERPGASADQGNFDDRIGLQGVKAHFPAPDVSFHYRRKGDWGHVQLAGIFRYISWTDTVPDQIDLSGNKTGWGVNASTNVKVGKTGIVRAAVVYGEGIENYMNDAPQDIGVERNPGTPTRPITGKALPVLGIVASYDFNWNDRFASAIGASYEKVDNSDGQKANAFKTGEYALANIFYYPAPSVMTGLEFQWGRRENFADGFKVDDYRIQLAAKFNFDFTIGRK